MDTAIADTKGLNRLLKTAAATPRLRLFAWLFLGWWAFLAFFYMNPQIDIAVSRMFFTLDECKGVISSGSICGHFAFSNDPALIMLRRILFYVPSATAMVLIWMLIATFYIRGAVKNHERTIQLSLFLASLIIGPYALVNLFLKVFSDRPRPYQTDIFGGLMPFEPAGSFAGQCEINCSFISGEAAGAGWIVCLIPLIPARYRMVGGIVVVTVAISTSALRVAFGGHYLSDAVLGFWSSLAVTTLLFGVAQLLRSLKKQRTSCNS